MDSQRLWDVIIVGAGPGGALCAGLLAQSGMKCLLLEKESLPRYKTCGGGVTARTVALLPKEFSLAEMAVPCYEAEFHFMKSDLHFRVQREAPIVYMTMRDDLDYGLTQWATRQGVTVQDSTKVEKIEKGNPITVVTTSGSHTATFLIGADGVHSIVAKQTFWPKQAMMVPAIEYEYEVTPEDQARFQHISRLDLESVDQGYGWVFPKKNHLSIGLGTAAKGMDLHKALEKYLDDLQIKPVKLLKRSGFVLPVVPRSEKLCRENVLLIGDAAGLVDPLTGEGIYSSILSGRLAALSLIDAQLQPEAVAQKYSAGLQRELIGELRAGFSLSTLFYEHPRLATWLFRLKGQYFCERMVDLLCGLKSYTASLEKRRWWFQAFERLGILRNVLNPVPLSH